MKIVSWNIERGYNPGGTVEFLRTLNADIYALYELDRGVKRTKGVDMFAELEKGLQMPGFYAKEFEEIESVWRYLIPWGGPGGGEIGNGIFTRLPVRTNRTLHLPRRPPLLYDRSTWIPELFQPRRGSRKAQVLEIETPTGILTCVAAHTELWRSNWTHRKEQLETALDGLRPERLALMGDFNTVGGTVGATIRGSHETTEVLSMREWLESQKLADPFSNDDVTCGRAWFKSKIDWIALGQGLRVTEKKTFWTSLSDHACLSVSLEVESEPSSRA